MYWAKFVGQMIAPPFVCVPQIAPTSMFTHQPPPHMCTSRLKTIARGESVAGFFAVPWMGILFQLRNKKRPRKKILPLHIETRETRDATSRAPRTVRLVGCGHHKSSRWTAELTGTTYATSSDTGVMRANPDGSCLKRRAPGVQKKAANTRPSNFTWMRYRCPTTDLSRNSTAPQNSSCHLEKGKEKPAAHAQNKKTSTHGRMPIVAGPPSTGVTRLP